MDLIKSLITDRDSSGHSNVLLVQDWAATVGLETVQLKTQAVIPCLYSISGCGFPLIIPQVNCVCMIF